MLTKAFRKHFFDNKTTILKFLDTKFWVQI
jgi:hypothetical protein